MYVAYAMTMRVSLVVLMVAAMWTVAAADPAFSAKSYYDLRPGATFRTCVDIASDGKQNMPVVHECGNQKGQRWKLTLLRFNEYKLTTQLRGASYCLQSTVSDYPMLQPCRDVKSQRWLVQKSGESWQIMNVEHETCLDLKVDPTKEGSEPNLFLRTCADVDTQHWKLLLRSL